MSLIETPDVRWRRRDLTAENGILYLGQMHVPLGVAIASEAAMLLWLAHENSQLLA